MRRSIAILFALSLCACAKAGPDLSPFPCAADNGCPEGTFCGAGRQCYAVGQTFDDGGAIPAYDGGPVGGGPDAGGSDAGGPGGDAGSGNDAGHPPDGGGGDAGPDGGVGPPDGGADAGASPLATKLGDGLTIEAVSSDQRELAVLTNPSVSGSTKIGDLFVSVDGGIPALVDHQAYVYGFPAAGPLPILLYYPTAGVTADTAPLAYWAPGMSAGVKLSTGSANTTVRASDGSWVLYDDVSGGVTKVWIARCSGVSCSPTALQSSLAAGTTLYDTALSPDNRFVAYALRTGSANPYSFETWLVNVGTGANTRVATESGSGVSLSFSTDGNLFATTAGVSPITATVFNTTSAAQTAWSVPAGTITRLAFSDAQTLVMSSSNGSTTTLYRTNATGNSVLAPSIQLFYIQPAPAAVRRYLFFADAQTASAGNVKMIDLQGGLTPVTLASSTGYFPTVSDDGLQAAFLESYDSTSSSGVLTSASLPSGTNATIASGVSVSWFRFVPGGSKLVYAPGSSGTAPFNLNEWVAGRGSSALDTAVFNFRVAGAPDRVYYTRLVGATRTAYLQPLP